MSRVAQKPYYYQVDKMDYFLPRITGIKNPLLSHFTKGGTFKCRAS